MSCLTDTQIQATADGEAVVINKDGEAVVVKQDGDAVGAARTHVASCARCQMRVRERQIAVQTIAQALSVPADLPADTRARIERSLVEGSTSGATRLRENPGAYWPWTTTRVPQRTLWSAGAVAAATLIAVVFVAPIVKGPSTVSAAEILAKSVTLLGARASTGTEVLEYDLVLDGVPRAMMPDHADGVYRVNQMIDHGVSGRYLLATRGPDGRFISAVAQDPVTRRRVVDILIDDQPYRFEFSVPDAVALSLPEMERLHMQASVAMMQASGEKHLQVLDTPAGRQYRIDVPRISMQTPTAVWDLTEATVVIDASSYHIVEFAVKGTFLKQPYSVSYRLIARSLATHMAAEAFAVPRDPRAIVIEGEGSAIPARDMLVASLREYARLKTTRDGR